MININKQNKDSTVDAEPAASLYRWSFNSTPGISRELNEYTSGTGNSVLTYMPRVAADYGTLQCWGKNALGTQRVPCTYHIVPAGKPDPPHSCSVLNVTHHSALITCKKGFDGGQRQKFVLVLSMGENVISNMSSSTIPEFYIPNLEATQDYSTMVSSFNLKGFSKPTMPLVFHTLPAPGLKEQRRSTEPSESKVGSTGPWLYILLAAGSTLIVAAAIGAIIFAIRRFRVESPVRNPRTRSPKMDGGPSVSSLDPRTSNPYTDEMAMDDNNPDLIPPANESFSEGLLDSSIVPYTITARPSQKRNSATQMPVKPYHVTWAPILQSRNCSTQTPLPHKESSV
ncbi:unnamed protein product [Brassicogethes aeneus]|uniref:Fibronectin type-III domain-containing protein n=1 Tax=Brassicogethes aeneus TaxID=1431903 RepID=A0A9P0FEN7_BRAAE|nr:unnamed protein product [Brassicogethes aeneus]